jgi:hypothetical protein
MTPIIKNIALTPDDSYGGLNKESVEATDYGLDLETMDLEKEVHSPARGHLAAASGLLNGNPLDHLQFFS